MNISPKTASPLAVPASVGWWELLLIALLLSRLYVPAESAMDGETCWLSVLSYIAFAIHCWRSWRNERAIHRPQQNWQLLGPGLLILGHVLSGLLVCGLGGDRRAAVNLAWEWLSVAALWWCCLPLIKKAEGRVALGWGLWTSTVVLAGFGLWQMQVTFPQSLQEVERLLQLEQNPATGAVTTEADQQDYQRLRLQYPELLELDETGRALLVSRVRNAQPLGRFALANTFAGLLLLGLGLSWNMESHRHWRDRACCGLSVAGLLVCLWFTQSRTAQLTLLCVGGGALATWGLQRHGQNRAATRWLTLLCGGAVVALVAVGVLAMLRPELFQGPLLSLKYRGEYWSATLSMLSESPLLGSGLGNFRQHYLQFKLPGSSEEILDPHNIILDVWANGGLLALAGLGLMLWQAGGTMFVSPTPATTLISLRWWQRSGLALGPTLLIVGGDWLLRGQLELTLCALLIPSGLLACLAPNLTATSSGWKLGWLALTLNWLGAGGIGMPAMLQLWLASWSISVLSNPLVESETGKLSPVWRDRLWLSGAGLSVLLAVGCLWTAVLPVTLSRQFLDEARHAANSGGDMESLLRAATLADPLDPEPWQVLGSYHLDLWKRSPRWQGESFDQAVHAFQESIDRDRYSGKRYRLLGQAWSAKFNHSRDKADAERGLAAYQAALERYPHYAPLHAELALLQSDAGQDGHPMAQRALELDELNRTAGHYDKMLPKLVRERLETILKEH